MGYRHAHYASWADFVDDAADFAARPDNEVKSYNKKGTQKGQMGTKTFDAAVTLARKGWPEGVARVKELGQHIEAKSQMAEQTRYSYDVTGHTLDVAAYLSGEPECWQSPEVRHVDGMGSRLVKVTVPINALWSVTADRLERKGAVICALVNQLELSGYACEIVMTYASDSPSKGKCVLTCTLKQFEHALDLNTVAYALANVAAFRRLGFAAMAKLLDNNGEIDTASCELPNELRGDVHVMQGEGLAYSDYEATRWCNQLLAKYIGN